eukprot:TRINITY_DN23951_c0_g1_i1.p1 TRINITY_DN23951_c0_g1~~TRINITY_DN23951_c0_g1_i1.p1  ORF type:complete len:605 (+),score=104.85 TRINITY_DN23951_c0_g1_i1:72-1886(+)
MEEGNSAEETPSPERSQSQDKLQNQVTRYSSRSNKSNLEAWKESLYHGLDGEKIQYSSELQRRADQFMRRTSYELTLGVIVVFNLGLMVLDVDNSAACAPGASCQIPWVESADKVLLGIYTLDVVCALFAQRLRFFKRGMNMLDATIVLLGFIEIIIAAIAGAGGGGGGSDVDWIRVFRIVRLLRIQKLLRPIPMLYQLVIGFLVTVRAIWWGFVMILILLLVWAIIILQLYEMIRDENVFDDDSRFSSYWCADAMHSTRNVMILLWQTLITGDSWGACSLPVILNQPLMYFVYAGAFLFINVGFQNLILAVIVDSANHRSEDDKLKAKLEQKISQNTEIERFGEALHAMDADGSGGLSLKELMQGFARHPNLQNTFLADFGIDTSDLTDIVSSFDFDDSGEVTYDQVVGAMFRSQRQSQGTQLMMINSAIAKLMFILRRIEKKIDEQGGTGEQPEDARAARPNDFSSAFGRHEKNLPTLEKAASALPAEHFDVTRQFQRLQFEGMEVRLRSISGTLHQQSLQLAAETRMLTATLAQLGDPLLLREVTPAKDVRNGNHDELRRQASDGSGGMVNEGASKVPEIQRIHGSLSMRSKRLYQLGGSV